MEKLKEKLKMGQNKSKRTIKSKENIENTNTTKTSLENGGSNSPPRSMKDILNSDSKTLQFRQFLSSIDEENDNNVEVHRLDFVLACRKMLQILSGVHSNPLAQSTALNSEVVVKRITVGGTKNEVTRTISDVAFDVVAVKSLATEMTHTYFHPTNQSRMVRLENSALRKKCGNVLSNIALESAGNSIPQASIDQLKKTVLKDGHYDALKLIEPLHQVFLRNRQKTTQDVNCTNVIKQLENCIL